MRKIIFTIIILFHFFIFGYVMAAEHLPHVAPEDVGMDSATLALIDTEVQKGLADKNMPGVNVQQLFFP